MDFINYPARKKKIVMAEATKAIVEDELNKTLDDATEEEITAALKESKKVVARKTKKGTRVKQVLKD